MKKKVIFGLFIILVVVSILIWFKNNSVNNRPSSPSQTSSQDKNKSSPKTKVSDDISSKYTIYNQESIYVVVDKKRPISTSYIPKSLVRPNIALVPGDNPEEQQLRSEAAIAAKQLFDGAKGVGLDLVMASGYRSAALQRTLFNNYAARDGQAAANRYSALPGQSEHQTGLALDITTRDRKCYLDVCFANTTAGKWLAANAHKYGFILRYKNGKEAVTGYQFEPWHYRYVGKALAGKIHNSGETMEEFFNLK